MNKKIILLLLSSIILVTPILIFAQDVSAITTPLNNFIKAALLIVGVICTIMIIVGGVIMLTAVGSAEKIAQGRQTIMWAVIGLVIALIASGITTVVESIAQ